MKAHYVPLGVESWALLYPREATAAAQPPLVHHGLRSPKRKGNTGCPSLRPPWTQGQPMVTHGLVRRGAQTKRADPTLLAVKRGRTGPIRT